MRPIDPFIVYLKRHIELLPEDIDFLHKNIVVQRFNKYDFLLEEGQISKAFYFNLSGFVRLFYLREGEERTAYFYPEGVFISAYSSFVRQEPSGFYLQASEDTEVVVISVESSYKILNYSNKFEAVARIAMEEELISHQTMVASLLTKNAEERYLELLNSNPLIFQKVPQVHIASYIGIKPQSLSRIKRRVLHSS